MLYSGKFFFNKEGNCVFWKKKERIFRFKLELSMLKVKLRLDYWKIIFSLEFTSAIINEISAGLRHSNDPCSKKSCCVHRGKSVFILLKYWANTSQISRTMSCSLDTWELFCHNSDRGETLFRIPIKSGSYLALCLSKM